MEGLLQLSIIAEAVAISHHRDDDDDDADHKHTKTEYIYMVAFVCVFYVKVPFVYKFEGHEGCMSMYIVGYETS